MSCSRPKVRCSQRLQHHCPVRFERCRPNVSPRKSNVSPGPPDTRRPTSSPRSPSASAGSSWPASRRRPSPSHRDLRRPQALFRGLLDVHFRYGLPARCAAFSGPWTSEASADSLPPRPFRLLPGGATNFPGGTRTRWRTTPLHGARCMTAWARGMVKRSLRRTPLERVLPKGWSFPHLGGRDVFDPGGVRDCSRG